ncbi:MAG: hypothetical protein MJ175_09460 [Clostridia bacterium]|nr:hypothetical protein [Clostridia bacterium]
MNNTIKVNSKNTLMVAHRGVSGLEKENTCAAFVAAGNRSYFGVETDIHRTGDGNFIILHDANTDRVSGDNINVEQTSFETLRRMQLNSRNEIKDRADLHLPSLEEYIGICRQYEKVCVLELKSDYTDDEIKRMIDRIDAMGYLSSVIFIAFNYENLKRVRAYKPEQPCQFLTMEMNDEGIARLAADQIDLDIYYPALSKELIDKLHANGTKINCWTVDKKEDAERLIGWGVDFITSNILEGC